MKIIENPKIERWEELTRRVAANSNTVELRVMEIISQVKRYGDSAVLSYSGKFDGVVPDSLILEKEYTESCKELIDEDLKNAIEIAAANIEKFHKAQLPKEIDIETIPGVRCIRRSFPIERVGIYIPGGGAPLFSTVLMLAIPAKIAGCKEVVLFTPPDLYGKVNPVIAYTAARFGVSTIVRAGGAQAIAAMAYGTESIKRVDKIFGPGNQYVTTAKQLVSKDVAIDMAAGPSELMVIADSSANPAFVAADLLSQAEHGLDSQVILLTKEKSIAKSIIDEVNIQKRGLPRKKEIESSLSGSMAIVFKSMADITDFANAYAPEHLIISTEEPWLVSSGIRAAGSIFIGNYSPESMGDYASGTNHTLPTGGWARSASGVGTESFMHQITYQEITEEGLENLGGAVSIMAGNESLNGHKNAVEIRLKKIRSEKIKGK
ncbi:MAG: histidinol dehydrogenase [Bacteroidales bacterium]